MDWRRITDFGHLLCAVGDGTRRGTVSELNTLSDAICAKAAMLLSRDRDTLLFIAGGNGAETSPRPNSVAGALPEAARMRLKLQHLLGRPPPVVTDCDPEFHEVTGLAPSGNTPDNARNVAAFLHLHPQLLTRPFVVAERMHLPRVIGTFRRKLADRGLLAGTHMAAYPVKAPFDVRSCQVHLRSEAAFRRWDVAARLHHVACGHVIRAEFLSEWLSGREYAHLLAPDA